MDRPQRFTFPFNYTPHPLAHQAAQQLMRWLENNPLPHDFGLEGATAHSLGKMFGVLVVEHPGGLGFLAAFSGKLGKEANRAPFVPPVYDRLQTDGFFLEQEAALSAINQEVEALENHPEYLQLQEAFQHFIAERDQGVAASKLAMQQAKHQRDEKRAAGVSNEQEVELKRQSQDLSRTHKRLLAELRGREDALRQELQHWEDRILALKAQRKSGSAALQEELFNAYQLRNAKGQTSGLQPLFVHTLQGYPPAGAGDCAAPKLLQYAYLKGYTPVCLAEFWWGQSPPMEVRHHGEYYPACRGKCEPILGFMLQGLSVDPNPMKLRQTAALKVDVLYTDAHLAVVHKPAELLSVPGKEETDSVYTRAKALFPDASGPLVVHRLDMSTSGLLLIAKNLDVYKALQRLFLTKKVTKRYEAVLDGELAEAGGTINLPLRVDLDNRPRQVVDFQHGKKATTHWEVVERGQGVTRVHFYPITGRTHQLRVHAAHPLGLGVPIKGDDLYGTPANRLHLHAAYLAFEHPLTKEQIVVERNAEF